MMESILREAEVGRWMQKKLDAHSVITARAWSIYKLTPCLCFCFVIKIIKLTRQTKQFYPVEGVD